MKSKIFLWVTAVLVGVPIFLLARSFGYEKAYGHAPLYETIGFTFIVVTQLIMGALFVNKESKLGLIARVISAIWLVILLIFANQTWIFSTTKLISYFISGMFIEKPLAIIGSLPLLLFYAAFFVIVRSDSISYIRHIKNGMPPTQNS